VCENSKNYVKNKDAVIANIESKTTYPVIVKPVNLGSSVGIKKARNLDELVVALEYAFEFSNIALIENAVENLKEINCSVLGDRFSARTSVCEEPINTDEILSYADKYLSGGSKDTKTGAKFEGVKMSGSKGSAGMADTKRKLPAEISKELENKVRELAEKSFKAIGCSGVTRVDFLYDTVSENLYVNELNTIPGSLSFYLWEATGLSFEDLLDELVKLAFKREREKEKLNFSFDTNILKGIKLARKDK
jgi:D-alanine-D-alanine ligase